MKQYDSRHNSAAASGSGRLADFLFVGVVVVPLVLACAGYFEGALLLFIPLLFAACLGGAWDQAK